MKKLLIFFAILGMLLYGGIRLVGVAVDYLTASVSEQVAPAARGDSFAADADNDGLSDGRERIYGTNRENQDTDGDGFLDGAEIAKGFDPTVAGEGVRIADNPRLVGNLTVQYFLWGQEKTGLEHPEINEEAVVAFLKEKGMDALKMSVIGDEELNAIPSGPDAVKQYLVDLANIQLPAETASFLDLAQQTLETRQTDVLGKVTAGLTETYESYRQVKTPPETKELHKDYLATLKALQSMFLDLYTVERDPVKLMRDIRWGNELVQKSASIESRRRELVKQYFPQPEPQPSENPSSSP